MVPVIAKQMAMSIDLFGCFFKSTQSIMVTNIGLVVTSTVDLVTEVDSTEVIHNQKCSERNSADTPIREMVPGGIFLTAIREGFRIDPLFVD